jgi:hypothetical protein
VDFAKPGTSFGTITLAAGAPGADGVATLAVASDSIIGFQLVDNSFVCAKIEAAGSHGKIDCDGGTPVGVTVTGDSHGAGANDPPVIMLEQGPPGRPGDGYFAGMARGVNCPGDPSGACIGTLATSADCANPSKVNFAVVQPMMGATTTGTATAQVINPNSKIGTGGPLTVPGMPFDCNNWSENGPGIIETPQVTYDTKVAGDTANVLQADD